LAVFAKNSGVKIYVVYAASGINNCDAANLQALATYTGGNFNKTDGDASKLPGIYDWIASQIMKEAGVETTMSVDMGTLEVNGVWVAYDPNDPTNTSVFDYIYEEGESTLIKNYYSNGTVIDQPWTKNQTSDFYDDHILHFDIGTISLNQIWEATYRLQALVNGTVKVPGPNTSITTNYSGVNISYDVPSDWISALPNASVKEQTYDLTINNFDVPKDCPDPIPLSWDLTYTGPVTNVVWVKLYYKDDEGKWILLSDQEGIVGDFDLPIAGLSVGRIDFKLTASAERAPTRSATNYAYVCSFEDSLTPTPTPTGGFGQITLR
jgi:hypothetical protein